MKYKITSIIDKLKSDNKTISFAESCTGGGIAAAFTGISGASAIFHGSCVTYSNDIKHNWLGVSHKTLQKFGAVSSECVSQMCNGIQKMANSDYSIAVSGIAGPTGGTELKPVGTVYIGVSSKEKTTIKEFYFKGNRESIQKQSVTQAIELFEKFLKNCK